MNLILLRKKYLIRIILPAILLIPLIVKLIFIEIFISNLIGTRLFGATQVVANDALIYFFIILLLQLSFLIKLPRLLSILFRTLAFLVLTLYIIDSIVIVLFHTHLVVSDIFKYSSYSLKYMNQTLKIKSLIILISLLSTTSLAILIIVSKVKIKNKYIHFSLIFLQIFLLIFSSIKNRQKYAHSWIYKNLFDYNIIISSESKKYSQTFINNFSFNENREGVIKATKNYNIIILMVESLSSYQSKFFSGIKDWTPNIDRIAQENISYKKFYANGYTTEDGEISILTGLLPIYPPSNFTNGGGVSFNSFYNIKTSLPNILKLHSYSTEFLTTADLSFANTGKWAKSIGFDYLEGDKQPYYNRWERRYFNAAPDEALYERVLDRIEYNRENNYFLFVKTVSTHHPFINPETGSFSESETFKYSDRQIGQFYNKLLDNGFFENGILIIVGDHHAMIPLKKGEIINTKPLRAAAKVPLIVSFGGAKTAIINDQYQQIDIFNSLKNMVIDSIYYSDWIGDIFSNGKFNPKYIAHKQGTNRNNISIFSSTNKNYTVKLNGDKTEIIDDNYLDNSNREIILKKINATRLRK